MPREKNTTARIVVPILAIALGGLLAVSVWRSSAPQTPAGPVATPPAETPADTTLATNGADATDADLAADQGAASEPLQGEPVASAAQPDVQPAELTPQGPEDGQSQDTTTPTEAGAIAPQAGGASSGPLRAQLFAAPERPLEPIGSVTDDAEALAEVTFTPVGAGIESITLREYYETLRKQDHYEIQSRSLVRGVTVASLAARSVEIDGQTVDLYASGVADRWIWRPLGRGAFEAMIVDADDAPVARITRRFTLRPVSYDIFLDQRFENLTERALRVRWIQYGPVDLPEDETLYGGDKRRLTFGHLLPVGRDASRQFVEATPGKTRQAAIEKPLDANGRLWPTDKTREGEELVWAAMTNRYFAFAVHTPVRDVNALPLADKTLRLGDRVYRTTVAEQPGAGVMQTTMLLELHSEPMVAEAGETLDLSLAAYAGPLWRKTLGEEETYTYLGLQRLVVYNFGGMCAWCTFQPLAKGLLWILGVAHNYLVFDWALAIMLLVVIVRTILHPVTKKSQISLQRFSKQMQALAPKQKKLQEKYKDDPKRLQQEMARLMREEGVSFTGALGCLPMFLQSPVWIALYAMLYFAFDLRHEPAFFGVFQAVTGGNWAFLADLSAPDRFIAFGSGFSLPLVGEVNAINILPLLLGAVFYVQQKYLTPPPSASMTPEQETQQKIMRVMMVVMFPLIMYNAPSGLSVYFITNSTLGILESRYIRAHIDQMDLQPKKPAQAMKRKRVRNEAPANPFSKQRDQSSKYKPRNKKR
ncbi:MAG: YidC/Oxa1 family insertase periplasmic-domain containing protein [Phycisphaerales bacterium]